MDTWSQKCVHIYSDPLVPSFGMEKVNFGYLIKILKKITVYFSEEQSWQVVTVASADGGGEGECSLL